MSFFWLRPYSVPGRDRMAVHPETGEKRRISSISRTSVSYRLSCLSLT